MKRRELRFSIRATAAAEQSNEKDIRSEIFRGSNNNEMRDNEIMRFVRISFQFSSDRIREISCDRWRLAGAGGPGQERERDRERV